ncbi:MAG: glycine C-acetyltransferase [Candidatus Marinimicrobia bacterium]|nr:glycine C-acetyltransferase [Candidatus Neomarinimicrobiota bacterium]
MDTIKEILKEKLQSIKDAGLFKNEHIIQSQQSTEIAVNNNNVLNFCANNYLGLSNNSELIQAAKDGLSKWGFGLSSVRFICGTQEIHKELEQKLSEFLEFEDTILYTSCFDANGGLFETLLSKEDAIISDSLNHASIIDGVRLCKAERYRYPNSDMEKLEEILKSTQSNRLRLITTDGVFSMDGFVAKLEEICNLAEKYNALVHVDDSHATGFFGKTGRGSIEHCNVMGRVDIVTSTLGKALGGASGGFTCASKEIITMLRQVSRPYLFSNTLAPVIVSASIACIDMLSNSNDLVGKLQKNTMYFRNEMMKANFSLKEGVHSIVPIIFGDAKLARNFASKMLSEGIYVIGFSYPVVPKGEARIRVQISASHNKIQLDKAIQAFKKIGKELRVI